MSNTPPKKLTAVMSVYNGEKFLSKTIASVLAQTYADFELVIIDDGSSDKSAEIINSYAAKDKRIRALKNEKNMGIVYTRNRCFNESNSEYIAIFDHDDISLPTRLNEQINFLESHPDFGLIGSWVEQIDENDRPNGVIWKNNIPPEEIPIFLLFVNYFAQSSVMIRKKFLPEPPYRDEFIFSEDYDLWIRIAEKSKVWSLPKILVKYRLHSTNILKTKRDQSNKAVTEIQKLQLKKLEIDPTDEELIIHRTNYTYNGNNINEFLKKRQAWLKKIKQANSACKIYNEKIFSHVISKLWLVGCYSNTKYGFFIWHKFWQSPLSNDLNFFDYKQILKFFIRTIIKK
jgi:glycosyltransferase involved in cell wall biosynthesis